MITYRNDTAKTLNTEFHNKQETDDKECFEILKLPGVQFWKGLKLRCKKYFKQGKMTFYTNFEYTITDIDNKFVTLTDIFSGESQKCLSSVFPYFSFCYAETGHSLQDITCQGDITIFDVGFFFASREWLWTSITRATDISKIYFYDGDQMQLNEQAFKSKIDKKIAGHKRADTQAGREWAEKEYIRNKDIVKMFRDQSGRCTECKESMSLDYKSGDQLQFSINRTDNKLAHTRDNCELTCLNCNVSMK